MSKISIIIPVFNAEEYLETCLDSVINQTLTDIEVIAIDDCSTDNSLSILNKYATKYPNIKVYHNEKNIGQGATRNRGISLSSGEYIGFVDSDDYINPHMYEDMYNETIIHNKPAIVSTGVTFVKDDRYAKSDLSFIGRQKGRKIDFFKNPDAICDESPAVWNKIFRSDFIKGFPFLETRLWEDVAFTFSKLLEASEVINLSNTNYFYRRQIEKGVSGKAYKVNEHHFDIFKITDAIEKHAKECNRFEYFFPQIRFIQFSTCFDRVDEINSWQISDEEKDKIKNQMYKIIYKKYGSLKNINADQLITRIPMQIAEEYNTFCLSNEQPQNKKS